MVDHAERDLPACLLHTNYEFHCHRPGVAVVMFHVMKDVIGFWASRKFLVHTASAVSPCTVGWGEQSETQGWLCTGEDWCWLCDVSGRVAYVHWGLAQEWHPPR